MGKLVSDDMLTISVEACMQVILLYSKFLNIHFVFHIFVYFMFYNTFQNSSDAYITK